jgi:hypothetical protein
VQVLKSARSETMPLHLPGRKEGEIHSVPIAKACLLCAWERSHMHLASRPSARTLLMQPTAIKTCFDECCCNRPTESSEPSGHMAEVRKRKLLVITYTFQRSVRVVGADKRQIRFQQLQRGMLCRAAHQISHDVHQKLSQRCLSDDYTCLPIHQACECC